MRGILTISMVALSLMSLLGSLLPAARADSGQAAAAQISSRTRKLDPASSGNAAYQLHAYRIKCIATRLNELWAQEHEIQQAREQFGRAGDMASVRKSERDLLAVRNEIDSLRTDLTRENRAIALMDNESSKKN